MDKQNLQNAFLSQLVQHGIPATVFLMNGVQIRGVIQAFETFAIWMESDSKQMMVYKHAISTIIPKNPVSLRPPASGAEQTTGKPKA